ncbi:MAG: glycosyltransferase [Desulfuromonadales bacterium]
MPPRVSVIIPAFNVEDYIEAAVSSALMQTEPDIEVLVADDGSTDGTAQRLMQIADPRFHFFLGDCNRGPSNARNRALSLATGEWIAFLDADDWYAPNRLEILLKTAATQKTVMVADDIYRIGHPKHSGAWSKLARCRPKNSLETLDAARFLALDCGVQPVIKRDFLHCHGIKFDESCCHGEDTLFLLECFLAGGRLALHPEAFYYYRWRPDSLTVRKMEALEQRRKISLALLGRPSIRNDPAIKLLLQKRLARTEEWIWFSRISDLVKEGNLRQAFLLGLRRPYLIATLGKATSKFLRHRVWERMKANF